MKLFTTFLVAALAGCEPPKAVADAPPAATSPHADGCRDDIPDCSAACALRETGRRDYLDFFDRRCAAVILGRNPDKVAAVPPEPSTTGSAGSPPPQSFPPDVRDSLMLRRDPFDPSTMSRTGGSDPPECKAARILRAQHRERDADMLDALCVAKGGDPGR